MFRIERTQLLLIIVINNLALTILKTQFPLQRLSNHCDAFSGNRCSLSQEGYETGNYTMVKNAESVLC